jgi:hypothetical protein
VFVARLVSPPSSEPPLAGAKLRAGIDRATWRLCTRLRGQFRCASLAHGEVPDEGGERGEETLGVLPPSLVGP